MRQVISTNIGEKVKIIHRGKEIETGIFKYAVTEPIFLGRTDVKNDNVIDRRFHGGSDKACYLYPVENYDYWKGIYPHLDWQWGMFGENLTIKGLTEYEARIGAVYKIGEAIVQVSQPRQPCYKLGIRFKDPKMVKRFSNEPFSGIYVRVLQEGFVKTHDEIVLIEDQQKSITISELFSLLMNRSKDQDLIEKAINDPNIAESAKKDLLKILNSKK